MKDCLMLFICPCCPAWELFAKDCIKSMHGNHVVYGPSFHAVHDILQSAVSKDTKPEVQKCIEQMPPESVSFVVEAVEARLETTGIKNTSKFEQLYSDELSVFWMTGKC